VIHKAPTQLIPELWPLIQEHAKAAMRWHPFMDEEDVLVQLLHGHGQLFVATDAEGVLGFAVVEVICYPSRRVANVLAAGGRKGFLGTLVRDVYPLMEKWAIEQGADFFCVMGRPGWLKYARQHEGVNSLQITVSQKRLGNVGWRNS